eukprot:jgi/Mesvir1/26386/Mv16079-RA.1
MEGIPDDNFRDQKSEISRGDDSNGRPPKAGSPILTDKAHPGDSPSSWLFGAQGKSCHGDTSQPCDGCQRQLQALQRQQATFQGALDDLTHRFNSLSAQRGKDQAHILELHARVLELERQLQAVIYLHKKPEDVSAGVAGTNVIPAAGAPSVRHGDTPAGTRVVEVAEQVADVQTKIDAAQGQTEALVVDVEAEVGASTRRPREQNAYLDARIAALEAHISQSAGPGVGLDETH